MVGSLLGEISSSGEMTKAAANWWGTLTSFIVPTVGKPCYMTVIRVIKVLEKKTWVPFSRKRSTRKWQILVNMG